MSATSPHNEDSSLPLSPDKSGIDDESFRLLIEAVQDYAIFTLQTDGTVRSWNLGAERIKGYRADEIIGRHFSTFYPQEDIDSGKPEWELEIAKRDGHVEDTGWRLRKDGSRFWANVVITAIFDDDGDLRGFAKVTRDLTERKAIEEARASFISNAAHELRTPLSVLVGLITFLQGAREAPTPEQLEEHLDTLGRAADRMRSLVNNLLDLTKLEQASVPVILERVSLSELVERALIAVPPPSNKRVESNVGDTYVLAEPGRLTQVLTNLLLNAYRYGGSNIGLRTRQNRSMVEVIVEDDGPGVEPSLRDHVFEPFRRGNTNNASEGSGLGMTIVKRFVESFGGTVSLDTTASGARFVVKLRKG